MPRFHKQVLIGSGIIVVAAAVAAALTLTRSTPQRKEPVNPGPLVEVTTVQVRDIPLWIRGTGSARPQVRVQVVPQVSGKVVEVHPSLVSGGFFRRGEPLLVIEAADYELAVQRAEAEVARAKVQLELEQAEAELARSEWDDLNPGQEPDSALVYREPQVSRARAELAAARANLDAARLNLERTHLSLPFDGRVVSENVDRGQYVVAGQPVASVYGTSVVEIVVPLEDGELAWFDVPLRAGGAGKGGNGAGRGSGGRATGGDGTGSGGEDHNGMSSRAGSGEWGAGIPSEVSADFAGARRTWQGRVVRTEGEIDPVTRMVSVVVTVEKPFAGDDGTPPLTPGMFLEVAIRGRTLKGVVTVPRPAVHAGDRVWVVEDGRLRIRDVVIPRRDREQAYISSGLGDGDLVVTSALETVTDGMKVRTRLEGAGSAGAGGTAR